MLNHSRLAHCGLKVLAALALGATLAAQAPPDGPGAGPCPPPMAGRGLPGPRPSGPPWLRLLSLTPAQEQAVKAIEDRHRAAAAGRRQAVGARAAELRDALEDPAAGEAQLRTLHAAESEARFQAALEERAAILEIHAVLTREQQAKAQRLRQKLQKEREAHREVMEEAGEGMEPGPGPGLGPGAPCR